jgi:hypothetical protein
VVGKDAGVLVAAIGQLEETDLTIQRIVAVVVPMSPSNCDDPDVVRSKGWLRS